MENQRKPNWDSIGTLKETQSWSSMGQLEYNPPGTIFDHTHCAHQTHASEIHVFMKSDSVHLNNEGLKKVKKSGVSGSKWPGLKCQDGFTATQPCSGWVDPPDQSYGPLRLTFGNSERVEAERSVSDLLSVSHNHHWVRCYHVTLIWSFSHTITDANHELHL